VHESRNDQVIVLTGLGVECRSAVRQCRSMETLVIDKSGGSINGNDGWQLVRTIKQRRKLLTLCDSKLRDSFDPHQATSVPCKSCAVSKIEIGKSENYIGCRNQQYDFCRVSRKST
jgi:hypothetical protein